MWRNCIAADAKGQGLPGGAALGKPDPVAVGRKWCTRCWEINLVEYELRYNDQIIVLMTIRCSALSAYPIYQSLMKYKSKFQVAVNIISLALHEKACIVHIS